jgi:signal recognition particle subunit SRP54
MLDGQFDLNDFSEQVRLLEKMGPLTETADEIPGLAETLPDGAKIDDRELKCIVAMISSMTEDERRHPERFVVNSDAMVGHDAGKSRGTIVYDSACEMKRVRRVAQGSGRPVGDVVDLLNRFAMMRQMMMQIGRSSGLLG